MRAAVLREFGTAGSSIRIEHDFPAPIPGADDVLIRVQASSINYLDVRMSAGYGNNVRKAVGGAGLPLVLGRDVVGTVETVGANVTTFGPGDEVWGVITPFKQGAHAELALAEAKWLIKKPASVGWHDAASFPYVSLTTWAALVVQGGVQPGALQGKLAFVLGGSGGVGSFAIQLLKVWGATVATTCSARNVDYVKSLGADIVIDYTTEDFVERLKDVDLVFDAAGGDEDRALSVMKTGAGASFVTVVHPTMPTTDQLGFEAGMAKVKALQAERIAAQAALGRKYAWCVFNPDPPGWRTIAALVTAGKIKACIENVYPLDKIHEAYARGASQRTRGKLIIDLTARSTDRSRA